MNLKKTLIAAGLAFSMTAPMYSAVFATATTNTGVENNGNGTVTISNATEGAEYKLYQIMKIDYYKDGKALYQPTNEWADFVSGNNAGAKYFDVITGEAIRYSWKSTNTTTDAQNFAVAAKKYVEESNINFTAKAIGGEDSTAYIQNVNYGWYLMTSSTGTISSLGVVAPNTNIAEKNGTPSVTKTVVENSETDPTKKAGDKNDAKIGDTITYYATVTIAAGQENYVLHDELSEGLKFTGVESVKLGGNPIGSSNYTVKESKDFGDDDVHPAEYECDFDVVFNDDYIKGLEVGDVITVEYTAEILPGAAIGSIGNQNKIELAYGKKDNPSFTPDQTTTTYVWELDIFKYTGLNTPLNGAKFELFSKADNSKVSLIKQTTTGTEGETVYKVAPSGTAGASYEIVTFDSGKVNIIGLDSGEYSLTETEAPAGYNKLKDPIDITIVGVRETDNANPAGSVIVDNNVANPVNVKNETGSTLPETGGMGTTMLYVAGGALLLGSAVFYMTNKKMKKD